jgi:hypothetical protein
MGLYDNVKCDYPLPWAEAAGFGFEWQTKSTDAPYMDRYEIRADGTLWHEQYTIRHEDDPKAPFGFWQCRDNPHWVRVNWNGEFEIHHLIDDHGWYQVQFWFRDGVVSDTIPHFQPRPKAVEEIDAGGPHA